MRRPRMTFSIRSPKVRLYGSWPICRASRARVTRFGTRGHTPGHIAVNVSSGSEELLLTGDIVVNSAVSFLHPEWAFGFDRAVPLATKNRMASLARAAADKTLVGSYHLPFPGFGHVVREGSAYRLLPAGWR